MVRSITIPELIECLRKLEIGERVNIVGWMEHGKPSGRWGIVRLDEGLWNLNQKVWMFCRYGGECAMLHAITDYDDEMYLKDDLIAALEAEELLFNDRTVMCEVEESLTIKAVLDKLADEYQRIETNWVMDGCNAVNKDDFLAGFEEAMLTIAEMATEEEA